MGLFVVYVHPFLWIVRPTSKPTYLKPLYISACDGYFATLIVKMVISRRQIDDRPQWWAPTTYLVVL